MPLRQADRKVMARDEAAEDIEVADTRGSCVVTARGRKYIDFVMGWCVGNRGWGDAEMRGRIRRFRGPDYVYPGHLYRPWVELADLLLRIAPGRLGKVFRATGGTEAVDIALQAAMRHTGRSRFVSIEGCYHGDSLAAASLGSSDPAGTGRPFLPCTRLNPPLADRAAEKAERALARKDVAALIMEPIVCNLGVISPAAGFMPRIQQACRRHGTLLIMDEVATGFGRTGKLFASEHHGVKPDILCLAKAITGGYAGMGAVLTTNAVAKSMADSGYYSTYGWHPLSVEAALANVRYMVRHRREIEHLTDCMSRYFSERLNAMDFRKAPEIRVRGLAIGIEFREEAYATRIADQCRASGLLLSDLGGGTLALFPALNIDLATARRGLDILERSL
jgi:4-aminobutyrate aminotransferase-like enzyme